MNQAYKDFIQYSLDEKKPLPKSFDEIEVLMSNFNEVLGVGGRTGGDSGVVSSPVAGGMMTIHGYAGIAVYNPYRSFIMRVNER